MQTGAAAGALPAILRVESLAALSLAALAALAIALTIGSLTRRLLRSVEGGRLKSPAVATATVRAVGRVSFVIALLVLAFPALDLAGVDLQVGLHANDVSRFAARGGVRSLFLVFLAFAANRFAAAVIRSAQDEIASGEDLQSIERRKRLHTVGGTARRFFSILIWTAATLMVLREIGVDITPVLTGAGIIGLAVGFGAQTLVKDIISGLFLIAEDQVRLGDVAEINGVSGAVEEINLRTIVLRDLEGTLHYVAAGEIRTLANKSKDFSYAVLDLGVGYYDDTDRIVDAVRAVAVELRNDPAYAGLILEPLEVLGVDAFKPTEVTLRFRIKTLPLKQWEVGRELRRRIKKAFDAQGIALAAPKLEVTLRQP